MFRVSRSHIGLESDVGDPSHAPAVGLARTASASSDPFKAPPLRQSSAKDWQDCEVPIRRADIKDRGINSRNDHRAASGPWKHKWSVVKLARTSKDISEERAQTRPQAAIDNFRASSPASQKALLQSREQQNVGPPYAVQREQGLPRSSNSATAKLAAVHSLGEHVSVPDLSRELVDDFTRERVERHLLWNSAGKQPREPQCNGARVNVASINTSNLTATAVHGVPVSISKLKSTTTTDRHAAAPSTTQEEKKKKQSVNRFKRALKAQKPKSVLAVGVDQADTSTPIDVLNLSDPSQIFTPVYPSVDLPMPRYKDDIKEERLSYTEHDLEAMKQRSAPSVASKPKGPDLQGTAPFAICDGNGWCECSKCAPQNEFSQNGARTRDEGWDTSCKAHTQSRKTTATCSGCWSSLCRTCSGGEWDNAAESSNPNSESNLESRDGVFFPDYHNEMMGNDEGLHGSRTIGPKYLDNGPRWGFDALVNFNDSDDEVPVIGSDHGEYLEQLVIEAFGNDYEPSDSKAWGFRPWPKFEDDDVDSTTPVLHTPTSGSDSRTLQEVDDVRAELTPRRNSATKILATPQLPRASNSDTSEESLERAMRTLGLGHFISIDMSTLRERLNVALFYGGEFESSEAASAFAIVSKHQIATQCWDRRLRWNDAFDKQVLDYEVDLARNDEDDFWVLPLEEVACLLGTTESDCRQRREFLMSQKAASSPCKLATDDFESSQNANDWTPELDQNLVDLRTYNNTWSEIAEHLDMDVNECKRRFKQIKPKGWKPKSKKQMKKEKAATAKKQRAQQKADIMARKTAKIESIVDEAEESVISWSVPGDNVWTPKQDSVLLAMAERDCWWSAIAEAVQMSVDDCIDRFEKLKPAQQAQQAHSCWGASHDACDDPSPPYVECRSCGQSLNNCVCSGWGNRSETCPLAADSSADAGPDEGDWAFAASHGNLGTWAALSSNGDSKPQPAPYTPPTITFWATVESAGKSIQFPIHSKHVSGPEKSIANGGMQQVWKWIHDKGLGDKVGLQDAFDLAQSIHQQKIEEIGWI